MEERQMRVQDLFKVVKTSTEREEYAIVIGRHLATEQKFKSREDAEEFIESKDYDLIWALVAALIDGKEAPEQAKLEQETEKEIKQETVNDL
jgi:hypothetical protein